ncbi:MAG: hypothetical protein IPK19_16190 [Chloroflexi bacterium]|nr:hypothetical protein [Chloroflexota bacterium]
MRAAEAGWSSIQKILFVPRTDAEYERLVQILNQLADHVGQDEKHPLIPLLEIIDILIELYEDEHVPEITDL